jgi:chemotaxis protein MotA
MKRRKRFQLPGASTLLGLAGGVAVIWVGHTLGGGSMRSILHGTAAIIVFGGTLAAVVVSASFAELRQAMRETRHMLFESEEPLEATISRVSMHATVARRSGILALEEELAGIKDPYLSRGLSLAIDGTAPHLLRELMEIENDAREEQDMIPARVFDAAGGYAPTFGILGAVLGLIHVMENLTDPDKLGAGIAVAFVATVYGVASANLVFLPIAAKLKARAQRAERRREVTLEGVLAVQGGLNPWLIEQKLRGFLGRYQAERGARSRKGRAA